MQWFLEGVFGAPPNVMMFLGDRVREWSPYVRIETHALWAAEPLSRKVRAVIRCRWKPDEKILEAQAREAYRNLLFGDDEDCGDHLGILTDWHLRREWDLDALAESDRARASALVTFSVLTRLRYKGLEASPLNLRLGLWDPYVVDLVYPMVAKMPVVSLRYFLDLHVHYAFNAIRRAKHSHGDDIISFLYDLLFLQQKTAIALLEYARSVTYAEQNKGESQLINAEVDAVMTADVLFAYLKASVEKTIALVGLTHGITNLDAKKDHKRRVAALRAGLPPGVDELPYASFLFSMVGSENLEDLNNYRSGLLHKKGIADLQPHNYVGQSAPAVPLKKIFNVLHEQHIKNTALLLVALALLTDRLVELDPPPFDLQDLPSRHRLAELTKRYETQEAKVTEAIESAQNADGAPGDLFAVRARLRRRLGRHREAVADFREGLERGAEPRGEVFCELGATLMDLDDDGKDAAAVGAFSNAITLSPDMDLAYLGRALAYENLGNLAAATADLDAIIPRLGRPAKALERRGRWRLALERYGDALSDFNTAAALGHEPLDLLTGRGLALRGLGDHAASLAALTKAVERYPSAVVARLHRATTRLAAGEVAGARDDLDQIINQSASHWKAHHAFAMRAALRAEEGDLVGAADDMVEALARLDKTPPTEWVAFLTEIRARLQVATDQP